MTSILNFDLEIVLKVTAKSLSKDIADEKWARLEKGGSIYGSDKNFNISLLQS